MHSLKACLLLFPLIFFNANNEVTDKDTLPYPKTSSVLKYNTLSISLREEWKILNPSLLNLPSPPIQEQLPHLTNWDINIKQLLLIKKTSFFSSSKTVTKSSFWKLKRRIIFLAYLAQNIGQLLLVALNYALKPWLQNRGNHTIMDLDCCALRVAYLSFRYLKNPLWSTLSPASRQQ